MNVSNLVKMANQIGSFFATMPNRQQAQSDIAAHIKSFWAPTMRHALLQYVEQDGGSDLDPIVLEAVRVHQATLV